jgi:hypothetical protein
MIKSNELKKLIHFFFISAVVSLIALIVIVAITY